MTSKPITVDTTGTVQIKRGSTSCARITPTAETN
jgi:hypothetical protein